MHPLDDCVGFDWDDANAQKNWERHRGTPEEAEEVFFIEPWVVRSDIRHSHGEKRYYALGQTSFDRYLLVAFTIRRNLIRVISVREMNAERRRSMASTKEQIPPFRSEEDERRYWAENDSTEFIDWKAAERRRFPHLKPSLRTISLRLPVAMTEDLKMLANKRDVPYQSLLKVFLAEPLEKERRRVRS
jgi:uncharacterized DUF497 family protein